MGFSGTPPSGISVRPAKPLTITSASVGTRPRTKPGQGRHVSLRCPTPPHFSDKRPVAAGARVRLRVVEHANPQLTARNGPATPTACPKRRYVQRQVGQAVTRARTGCGSRASLTAFPTTLTPVFGRSAWYAPRRNAGRPSTARGAAPHPFLPFRPAPGTARNTKRPLRSDERAAEGPDDVLLTRTAPTSCPGSGGPAFTALVAPFRGPPTCVGAASRCRRWSTLVAAGRPTDGPARGTAARRSPSHGVTDAFSRASRCRMPAMVPYAWTACSRSMSTPSIDSLSS
jgi:hypothetical protein